MNKIYGIGLDRIVRGVIGAGLLTAGFINQGRWHDLMLAVGAVMLITAVTGACAFGSSCAVEPVKAVVKKEDVK